MISNLKKMKQKSLQPNMHDNKLLSGRHISFGFRQTLEPKSVCKNSSGIMSVIILYLVIYSIVFCKARYGLGMFWDWNWPLFRDHLGLVFTNQSASWTDSNLGSPMFYNSSFYSNYFLSLFKYTSLQPETCLYLFLTLTASATSFGVYLIAKKKLSPWISFIFGLLVVLNPAYLYKLLAGHISYLISLAIFVYFIYFLYYKFKNNFKSATVLGLLLAFVGVQIQFFILALIVLAVYYILNIKRFKARYLILILMLALLINLPWLSNFLIGANSVSGISGQAGDIAFNGASRTSLLRIATLTFSDATLIKYLYPKYIFGFFGLFSLGLAAMAGWRIVTARIKPSPRVPLGNTELRVKLDKKTANCELRTANIPNEFWQVLITLLVFVFLGTGVYQSWNIPIVKIIYPMLRESGHLAPVIVLFMILLLVRLWSENKWIKWPIVSYLMIFAAINAFTIYKSLPTLDYTALRERLAPYKEFLDNDSSLYRIAAYPFFGQYSVAGEPNLEVRGQPVRNTGINVFSDSSTYDSLSNYVSAQNLDQTIQYQFLTTLDLSMLENRNIKYLLDLSDIYQSNIEKYSDPSYYHNNLALIKNDPTLFPRLLAMYPARIKQVAPHVYQLTKSQPRVSLDDRQVQTQKINLAHYRLTIDNLSGAATIKFLESYHAGWQIQSISGQLITSSNHRELADYGQSWSVDSTALMSELNKNEYQLNADGSINLQIEIYFAPQRYFEISRYISMLTIILALAGIAMLARGKKSNSC